MEKEDLTLNIFLISVFSMIVSGLMYADSNSLIRKYNISLDSLGELWYRTGFVRLGFLALVAIFSGRELIEGLKNRED